MKIRPLHDRIIVKRLVQIVVALNALVLGLLMAFTLTAGGSESPADAASSV